MFKTSIQNFPHFFEAVVETASDVVLTFNEDGQIVTCNRAVIDNFGYTPDELKGQSLGVFMLDQYYRDHEKALRDYLATGESNFLGVGKRIEARDKSGTVIPVSFTISEISFQNQRYFSAVFRNIARILNTEKELEKVARELARSNAHLEEFASLAAHDLQAPLRTVSMLVGRLSESHRDPSNENTADIIRRVEGAAHRMQGLIHDLLNLCQFRKAKNVPKPVDSNLVFDKVTADLLAAISDSQGSVTRADLPRVVADEGQLGQLMQNLISNAIKFRRPGALPEVKVTAAELPSHWEFCVADNGIGIDAGYFSQIFLPFRRLHGRSEYPGNGIGLAMCKEIVERQGGTIRVESSKGSGSKFYFNISKDGS